MREYDFRGKLKINASVKMRIEDYTQQVRFLLGESTGKLFRKQWQDLMTWTAEHAYNDDHDTVGGQMPGSYITAPPMDIEAAKRNLIETFDRTGGRLFYLRDGFLKTITEAMEESWNFGKQQKWCEAFGIEA